MLHCINSFNFAALVYKHIIPPPPKTHTAPLRCWSVPTAPWPVVMEWVVERIRISKDRELHEVKYVWKKWHHHQELHSNLGQHDDNSQWTYVLWTFNILRIQFPVSCEIPDGFVRTKLEVTYPPKRRVLISSPLLEPWHFVSPAGASNWCNNLNQDAESLFESFWDMFHSQQKTMAQWEAVIRKPNSTCLMAVMLRTCNVPSVETSWVLLQLQTFKHIRDEVGDICHPNHQEDPHSCGITVKDPYKIQENLKPCTVDGEKMPTRQQQHCKPAVTMWIKGGMML